MRKYEADDPGLFYNRPKWRRALVVFMGPFINFVSALLAIFILFNLTGAMIPQLSTVEENTVLAQTSDISAGDKIISINGYRIHSASDASMALLLATPGADWDLVYIEAASGQKLEVQLPPQKIEQTAIGITYIDDNGHYLIQSVAPDSNNDDPVLLAGDAIIAKEGIAFTYSERIC